MLYSPFYEFDTLRKVAKELFRDRSESYSGVPGNIYSNENGYIIQLPTPGVKKDDVEINYENGYLSIAVKRSANNEETVKDLKVVRQERSNYDFTKRYAIPEESNIESIHAEVKDGYLMIHVPSKEKVEPKKISVKVK